MAICGEGGGGSFTVDPGGCVKEDSLSPRGPNGEPVNVALCDCTVLYLNIFKEKYRLRFGGD
jgi:hypothetical protein